MKKNIKRLAVSAILLATAVALTFVPLPKMPFGGSITFFSLVPITLISVIFGVPWGLFSSFVYALLQIGLDLSGMMAWGMDARMWIGALVFDYLIAYTTIGLSGLFRKKGYLGILCGVTLALVLRFISHFVSGWIFFDIWMPETFTNEAFYSLCYNGAYMLPELLITLAGVFVLYKTNTVKRLSSMVE